MPKKKNPGLASLFTDTGSRMVQRQVQHEVTLIFHPTSASGQWVRVNLIAYDNWTKLHLVATQDKGEPTRETIADVTVDL